MATAAPPEPPPSAPADRWEDFVDIYLAPHAVFARRRDGRFGVALVVFVLMMALLYLASLGPLGPVYDAEMNAGIAAAQGPGITLDAEQTRLMSTVAGVFAILVGMPLGVFLIGGVLLLIGRAFGVTITFAVAVVVATYSQFPKILQSAAFLLQGLLREPRSMAELSIGPLRFLDHAALGRPAIAALSQLDLFVLWGVALLAIGLHVAGRFPRTVSYLVAILAWVLAALPSFVSAFV